ncbi:wax ester/triacylglycerol synthase family O-acyltransferase [Mycobacterium sp.]|uniref:wax ester/triacylglycerol synthase family O-acyltransferase n=1 Tax=Mycobacterium sp. TaxID=1785 RepID=UPI000CAC166A|nr:wax ester/triacylglycerol synthase family O-acyltransferase [Mycobacterium sp.]PJE16038.1 MAG: wax ester/triacylglycerol synthase family O-acyltransferase [Mycobacterium sp.]
MRRLSGLDAQFLAAEGGNSGSQYCGLAIYQTGNEKPITAATMRQRVADRVDQCPPLRWKLVTVPLGLDRPAFVNTDVNLEDHVHETTLAEPADEAALGAEVAKILSSRLDRGKPLWKLIVLHGLPGRTAVVTVLHHAAVDGIAAGEIFAALLDGSETSFSASGGGDGKPVPSRAALALSGIASLPVRRIRALRSAGAALAHLDQVPALRSLPGVHTVSQIARGDLSAKPLNAPRTRFNAKLSPRRSVAFGTVSLSDVKAIRKGLGVTVNDVVIALCAGALRRRLTSTGDLPADPLVAYIPVSTRLPDAQDRYGNAISAIIAPIPTHLSSAHERLTFAHDTLGRAKERARQAPPTLMSDVNDPIPGPIFGIAARGLMELVSSRFVRPPVNVIISNVPGSPVKLACHGAPLLAHYPTSLVFDGFTLNITVVSYEQGLDIGIVGDAETLPDAWDLMNDIRLELAELTATVSDERSTEL